MQAELFSWGAAQEVTGSKHFVRIKDRVIMVDCGAFQGRRKEADAKNRTWSFDAKAVDAVLLSHAHYDHCGLLPLMPKKGFEGNVYATPATRDLASLIMMDSAHIQEQDADYQAKTLGAAPRIAVEAACKFGWTRYVDTEDDVIGMTGFGASAPASDLYAHFGITKGAIIARAKARLQK